MVMCDGLQTLADLVGRVEGGGVEVEDVSITETDGEGFQVDLSLRLSDDGEPVPATAPEPTDVEAVDAPEPGSDVPPTFGARAVQLGDVLEVPPGPSGGDAVDDATDSSDGTEPEISASSSSSDEVPCRVEGCDATFETEHGMKIHATKAHQEPDGSAPSAHRNPERLRDVYEAHDTFEEMTEALDVDVTPQTVRRSMMSLGIHDPDGSAADDVRGPEPDVEDTASDTAPDGSEPDAEADVDDTAAEPVDAPADTDGPDDSEPDEGVAEDDDGSAPEVASVLPPSVDPDVLVTAVREASTLYQVQRAMNMEREEVQTLLAELDLLDLVTGRVVTEDERKVTREEVERRILDRAAPDRDPEPVSAE